MLVQVSSKQRLGTLSERPAAVRSLRPRTCGRRRARLYAGPPEGSAALVPSLGGGSPGPYSSALAMSSEGGEDSCVAAKHKGSHVTPCSHVKRFFPRVQWRWRRSPCPRRGENSGGDRPDARGSAF